MGKAIRWSTLESTWIGSQSNDHRWAGLVLALSPFRKDVAQKGPVVPPARASCRDPIERVNLLRAPATLVTLLIAVQGLTPTPSSATSELPRQYDLIRVVALGLTVWATVSLTCLMGCCIAAYDQY